MREKLDNIVIVKCDSSNDTYYYVPPPPSTAAMVVEPIPFYTTSKEDAIKKVKEQRNNLFKTSMGTTPENTDIEFVEGSIHCAKCKCYYNFQYAADPSKNMEAIPGQEIHVRKEKNKILPWEEKWFEYWRDSVKDSPKTLDEAAKYVISLVSGVIAIYTGGLTFLGITKITGSVPFDVTLIVPIIFWLASLILCLYTYSPSLYTVKPDSITAISTTYQDIAKKKNIRFVFGVGAFIFGIFLAALILLGGIGIFPELTQNESHTVQFIVLNTSSQKLLDELYITTDTNTNMTKEVILAGATDSFYEVDINDSCTVKFSKDIVDGIIYWD